MKRRSLLVAGLLCSCAIVGTGIYLIQRKTHVEQAAAQPLPVRSFWSTTAQGMPEAASATSRRNPVSTAQISPAAADDSHLDAVATHELGSISDDVARLSDLQTSADSQVGGTSLSSNFDSSIGLGNGGAPRQVGRHSGTSSGGGSSSQSGAMGGSPQPVAKHEAAGNPVVAQNPDHHTSGSAPDLPLSDAPLSDLPASEHGFDSRSAALLAWEKSDRETDKDRGNSNWASGPTDFGPQDHGRPVVSVPEPGTLELLALSIAALALTRRKRLARSIQ